MWRKVRPIIFLSALAACLWWPCAGSCSESRMYQISESELTALEHHLNALEANNETLTLLLSESDEGLTIAAEELTRLRRELSEAKRALEESQKSLTQMKSDAEDARASLQTANAELQKALQSVEASEKEHRRRETQLERQRVLWQIIAVIVGGVAVAK